LLFKAKDPNLAKEKQKKKKEESEMKNFPVEHVSLLSAKPYYQTERKGRSQNIADQSSMSHT